MAKPKQTPDEPLRSKLEAALAQNTRRTRTLATLQKHLTEGTILQVLDTLTAIAKGTITENKLPQRGYKLRVRNRTSRYLGVSKQNSKWRAQIKRDGVTTELGLYEEELTAAAVHQAVDREYSRAGFAQRNYKPPPCTCAQPAETCASTAHGQEETMSSRPSTYHMETLAENRRL